jgi:hypothetical protein
MQTLTLHFPDDALPPFDTFVKQTREARVCRRAQAVREVVKGQRLHTVSDALSCTSSALRQWGYRFANHGTQGFVERPRSGRPPKITCALAQPLQRLVAQAPLQPIYMKLSVDSLHQGDGFVLFCQTFSEDLSRGVSFS